MKKILLIAAVMLATATHLRAQVVFNATNFPDANFRQYLKDNFSSKGFTTEGVTISAANLKSITEIRISYNGIANFKGLEYFTELRILSSFMNKQLTELDVSKNTKLEELSCTSNALTSLNISKNNALKKIDCMNNQLENLDVSQCTSLEFLKCDKNQLTTLDVSKCTKLRELECHNNKKLTSLNVSNCSVLNKLVCQDCQLPKLDVSKCTKLTLLECNRNKLTSLDVSKNTALVRFGCQGNPLTKLDVSKNTALVHFACGYSKLTTLDLTKNTLLDYLECGYSELTALNLTQNTNLATLHCTNNHLASLDLSKNTKLFSSSISPQFIDCDLLVLSNTKLGIALPTNVPSTVKITKDNIGGATWTQSTIGGSRYYTTNATLDFILNSVLFPSSTNSSIEVSYDFDSGCTSNGLYASGEYKIMHVFLVSTPYVACGDNNGGSGNFPDNNFRTVVKTSTYDKNTDGKLSREELQALTSMNAASKGISKFNGLEYMKYLATLNCSGNTLGAASTLPLTYNTELTNLNCSSNGLTGLDISNSTKLQYLTANSNNLGGTLYLGSHNALKEINVHTNKLTGLKLPSTQTALLKLWCYTNQLTTLSANGYTAMTYLDCHSNKLSTLNVSSNSALQELYCHDQADKALTSLTLPSTKTALLKLRCSNNSLTTALSGIGSYPNLTLLWCAYNKIPSLDVSKNTKLVQLYTDNNQLTSLQLPQTTSLEEVNCYNNKIPELNVTGCTKLWKFQCQNNCLRTLDLSKNAALTTLNCATQTSTEDVTVFDYSKIGVYLPSGGKKANFLNMQVAGAARTADVLTNSSKQYLVVNPTPTGDVDLYGKAVTYSYNTECPSTAITNKNMTGVTVTTYPYVMWVNPNSKSVAGNYYSGTIVLGYDAVVPAGTEAYIITGLKATPREMLYDGTKYSLQQLNMKRIATAGQVIPKNTPVYVKSATQDGLFAFGRNLTGATPVTVPAGNLLKGSATAAITGLEPYSILTLGREKTTREVGFWQYSGTTSAIHRCYLEASILNSTSASGAKGAVFCFDEGDEFGGTTDIGVVGPDSSAAAQDVWYTINGVRLDGKPSKKGIYIHNGRKEVVR